MNDSGVEMMAALRQVRSFCVDVSYLLEDAELHLKKHGLARIGSSALFRDCSAEFRKRERWFPQYACAVYGKPAVDALIAYVAVVWDYLDGPESLLRQPMVTAGVIDYSPRSHPRLVERAELQFLHLHMPDRDDNGGINRAEAASLKGVTGAMKRAIAGARLATLAVPLVNVTGQQALRDRVTDRLLAIIGE